MQYTIESLFAVYRTKFKEYPAIHPDLDLVESEDQFTHDIGLNDNLDKVRHVVQGRSPNILEERTQTHSGQDRARDSCSCKAEGRRIVVIIVVLLLLFIIIVVVSGLVVVIVIRRIVRFVLEQ